MWDRVPSILCRRLCKGLALLHPSSSGWQDQVPAAKLAPTRHAAQVAELRRPPETTCLLARQVLAGGGQGELAVFHALGTDQAVGDLLQF